MIDVNVILSVEKLKQKVEANVHVRGKDIFCESDDADMYAAIDALVDKLDRTDPQAQGETSFAAPRPRLKHQA